jgi:hypothetical protein
MVCFYFRNHWLVYSNEKQRVKTTLVTGRLTGMTPLVLKHRVISVAVKIVVNLILYGEAREKHRF